MDNEIIRKKKVTEEAAVSSENNSESDNYNYNSDSYINDGGNNSYNGNSEWSG